MGKRPKKQEWWWSSNKDFKTERLLFFYCSTEGVFNINMFEVDKKKNEYS